MEYEEVENGDVPALINSTAPAPIINTYIAHADNVVIHNEPCLEDPCAQKHVEDFLKSCRDHLIANTQEKITGRFKSLRDPKGVQVCPKICISDYYNADTFLDVKEYRAEPICGVQDRRKIKGEKINLEQLHDKVEGHKSSKYTAIIADAGAGKTTLAKRYARMVHDGKIRSMSHIKLVLFVSFAKLDAEEKYTTFDLLFSSQMRLTPKMKEYGRLWVQENTEKILFVLDGLDQAPWVLEQCPLIDFDKEKMPASLIYNLLHGNLFPNSKVLITSREHAVRMLDANSRPERILSLEGLSEKDIKSLVQSIASNGDDIIEHLKTNAPGLYSVCSVPMFLIFTTAILAKDLQNAPETLSGVLMRVLYYFINSENCRVGRQKILSILENLSKLAFNGISEKKVIFTEQELRQFGLDAEAVCDLILITPDEDVDDHYQLMEGCFKLFFCHQSIQEALCALDIIKKEKIEFSKFIYDNFSSGHWEVVLRILLGVLLNERTALDVQKLQSGGDEEKQILKKCLRVWLVQVVKKSQECAEQSRKRKACSDQIPVFKTEQLCVLLYECGKEVADIIRDNVRSLRISKQLRVDQLHAVSWAMSNCSFGVKVQITSGSAGCSLDLLCKGLCNASNAKIEFTKWSLEIRNRTKIIGNTFSYCIGDIHVLVKKETHETFHVLQSLLQDSFVEKLVILSEKKDTPCQLPAIQDLDTLLQIKNAKVKHLNFSRKHCARMSFVKKVEVFKKLGELTKMLQVDHLQLENCSLNESESAEVKGGIGNYLPKVLVTMEKDVILFDPTLNRDPLKDINSMEMEEIASL